MGSSSPPLRDVSSKRKLIDWVQDASRTPEPLAQYEDTTGDDFGVFQSTVKIGNMEFVGTGPSAFEAECNAAESALSCKKKILKHIDDILSGRVVIPQNPKRELYHFVQDVTRAGGKVVEFFTSETAGKFKTVVVIIKKLRFTGTGDSQKSSELSAAQAALRSRDLIAAHLVGDKPAKHKEVAAASDPKRQLLDFVQSVARCGGRLVYHSTTPGGRNGAYTCEVKIGDLMFVSGGKTAKDAERAAFEAALSARGQIESHIEALKAVHSEKLGMDAKRELIDWVQRESRTKQAITDFKSSLTPDSQFHCIMTIGSGLKFIGIGKTEKDAELAASANALGCKEEIIAYIQELKQQDSIQQQRPITVAEPPAPLSNTSAGCLPWGLSFTPMRDVLETLVGDAGMFIVTTRIGDHKYSATVTCRGATFMDGGLHAAGWIAEEAACQAALDQLTHL